MCDSITNGGPVASAAQPCPPANVIIASNVLNTNGNVIAGNIFSQDGTFTGNLYVAGSIISNISYTTLNVSGTVNAGSVVSGSYSGNASGLSNLNAANLFGTANLTNLFVTNLSFQNSILSTNLPILNTAQGTWGSSANVSQVTVDQYGRVSNAANVAITSSQWTSNAGNVAYGNGVSIGTLVNPPPGSNLYVVGTANMDTLNVTTLFANSATVFGSQTLNVLGTSNLNIVTAGAYYGNGAGLSNLNASNLALGIVPSALILGNTLSNIQLANVSGFYSNTLSNLNASNLAFGTVSSTLISGNALSNLNASNLLFGVVSSALIYGNTVSNINGSNVSTVPTAQSVTSAAQPNITSVGNLTSLNVAGVFQAQLLSGNASALSNITGSNVSTVPTSQSVTSAAQPNITSVGFLSSLSVFGAVYGGSFNGSGAGLTGVPASSIAGTVATSQSVVQPAQPNITSLGTLSSLSVSGGVTAGTFYGSGAGLTNLPASNISGTVQNAVVAQVVSQPSQPNITSVGTLTNVFVIGTSSAGTFVGDGYGITNIQGTNVSGPVPQASVVVNSNQPYITSLGTLTGLSVNGTASITDGSGILNITTNHLTGILPLGLFPVSGVSPGTYGSSANVSQVSVDQYGRVTTAANVAITSSQWVGTPPGTIYYQYFVGIGSTATPTSTLQITGNVWASNAISTPNVYFTNTIQATNLPNSGVLAGSYGSSSNLVQVSVDQYGRVTSASNTATQWTFVQSNVAYGNGVSVGTLSSPPTGSNLYVLGTANVSTLLAASVNATVLNVISVSNLASLTTNLIASVANVATLNVLTISNLNSLSTNLIASTANVTTLNVISVSNLESLTTNLTATLANVTVLNVASEFAGSLNVSAVSNLNSLVTPLANITSGFIGSLNVSSISNLNSLVTPLANVSVLNVSSEFAGSLNVSSISNLNSLVSPLANVTSGFVGSLNVSSISNLNSLVTPLANVTLLNTASEFASSLNVSGISNLSSLVTPLANVASEFAGSLNVSAISNLNSLVTPLANVVLLNTASEFVGSLNVSSISNLNSLVTPLANVSVLNTASEFVGSLNVSSISNLNSLVTPLANVSVLNTASEFVGSLNVSSISNLNSLVTPLANVSVLNTATEFVGSLNVSGTSNLTALVTPLANVASEFVGSLNVSGTSNLTALVTPLANVSVLNVASEFVGSLLVSTANVTTLNVGSTSITNLFAKDVHVSNALTTTDLYVNGTEQFTSSSLGLNNQYSQQIIDNNGTITLTGPSSGIQTQGIQQVISPDGTIYLTSCSSGLYNQSIQQIIDSWGTVYLWNGLQISGVSGSSGQFLQATGSGNDVQWGSADSLGNLNASNLAFGVVNSALIHGNTLSNINSSNIVQPFANLVVSNSVTVSNLIVSSNILPYNTAGNTYVVGNVVVAGNVYSSLGQLGAGGGYYLSLPTNIAVQSGYNGPIYGATYPLSIGLSNGFTINGTSTLITITTNGNFKFSQAGPYILNAVFNSSDNVTGLDVGSNVADIHGQDQEYLYRYTTFVSQNPTEVITIPINVTDPSLYYYLDLFKVDAGQIYSSSNTTGGTYLTITPLTGGGLATGGPGGTPGTQWISSASNIYFPNAIGVGGAPTPGYNLTVTGQSQMGNVIPTVDNLYNLGTPALRWANLQIGPGTIYIQDQAPPYTQVGISVYDGTLLLDGVQSIRTGNVAFIDPVTNNAATMNVTNKVVTYSNVSAVKANAVIYSDGLTQSNAYIKPTAKVYPTSPTISAVDIDLSTSNAFIHCHCNGSLSISVSNATPAKQVQLFAYWGGGGSNYIVTGGGWNTTAVNGTNPYYVTKSFCVVTVTSMDSTISNTFMVINNF